MNKIIRQIIVIGQRTLAFFLLMLCILPAFASKSVKITGEYTYYMPENVTLEQAKQTALLRARLAGLSEEFGMLVGQDITTVLENINGESSASVYLQTMSNVKGEWLRDLEKAKFHISCQDEMIVVHVIVKFEAREIKSSAIDFEAKLLRNGMEDKFESNSFKSGDDFYLSFMAPQNGYLAVYLVKGDVTQCLLPYREQTDGICRVRANKRYVFFSRKEDENPYTDEYVMMPDKPVENDVIYVIFSPNEFSKAVDVQSDQTIEVEGTNGFPRKLSSEKFLAWLSNLKLHDERLSGKAMTITISK
jgi:hypothetical protein